MNEVTIHVNGVRRRLAVDPRTSLLDLLRERMSGNLRRCGAYVNLVGAITSVRQAS